MAIDGILIGEHAPCESLTDDNHGLFPFLTVETVEITAGDDGNANRGKEAGRNDAPLRARILFAGGMNMTVGGELESEAAIAPWNRHAESGRPLEGPAGGKRGTNAKITAATMASAAPTQSRLESTVKSSARTEKREA